jgi:flagellar biosynthesis protein FliR
MELDTVAPVAARIFGVLVTLPIGDGLQLLPRLFIAICFALPLASSLPVVPFESLFGLLADFVIGVVVAVPSRVMAEVGAMFGEIVDTARGQTIGSVLDPLQGQQGSDLSTIVRLGVVVLVVWLAGIEGALGVVCQTFDVRLPAMVLLDSEWLMRVIHCGFALAGAALELASIWLFGFLMVDLGCALMAKVAFGLSFSSLGQLLKLLVAFILLLHMLSGSGPTQARIGRVVREPALINGMQQTIGGGYVR